MSYLDPKTNQIVPLTGTPAEQNATANQAGYNYVADPTTAVSISSLGNTMNTSSLPPKPDMAGQYNSAMAGAVAGASTPGTTWTTPTGAVVDVSTGNVITPAKNQPSEPTAPKTTSLDERIRSMLGFTPSAPTSSVDQYSTLQTQNDITGKQQNVNDLQAQLNSITAQSQADQLSTIGKGTGIPQAIIGGQQAQIAREAAIRALPVTAALNAAQGRLQSAESNINTLMGLIQKDSEAKYKYQSDQIDIAMKFADADQKAALEARKAQLELAKTDADSFNKAAQSYVDAAIKAGDYATAGKLATATSYEQLQQLATGIQSTPKLDAGIVGEYQFAVQKGYKGSFTDYQNEDANRKKAIAAAGVAQPIPTAQDITNPQTVKDLSTINQINNVLADPNFADAFGINGKVAQFIPGSPAQKVIADVQQIRDILSLAARGQLKGQGQISDFEGRMLANSQTALNSNLNSADAKQALVNVRGAITTSSGGSVLVAITDPKTGETKIGSAKSADITKAISDGYRVTYQQ